MKDYKKLETYEPEVPGELEYQPKELGWLKTICLCMGMIIFGGGLAFVVVVTGMTPQFLTDQDCFALQNESFINGTNQGYVNGKIFGALEVSQGVLNNDTMPVFFLINETTIGFNMINLKDYYLNLSGVNNG